jgi:membrane protein YdbS with pleckstrin-like domain
VDAVFRSKVDLWLGLLMVGAPILALDFFLDGSGITDVAANLISALAVVLVLCLFAWLYFTTLYTITAEALFVKSGPFTWVVSLREITSIEPTRRPASARLCRWIGC